MQFLLKYIIASFVLLSLTFAMEKSKKGNSNGGGLLVNVQEMIAGEDENNIDRKRAHKRKRKIRPRRNGF